MEKLYHIHSQIPELVVPFLASSFFSSCSEKINALKGCVKLRTFTRKLSVELPPDHLVMIVQVTQDQKWEPYLANHLTVDQLNLILKKSRNAISLSVALILHGQK